MQGAFAIDINAMVFGMPRALFPELGTRLYGGGAGTVGLLYAAPGVGALVGGAHDRAGSGAIKRPGRAVRDRRRACGASPSPPSGWRRGCRSALLLLAVAGAADVVSAVFRNTIVQLTVPDRLRGRLNALNIAVVTGGPRLGDLEAGAVAAADDARGSRSCRAGWRAWPGVGVLGRLLPELRGWQAPAGSVDPP